MNNVVPSLSTAGFVSDVPTMIDKMLAYYLTSDYSQSNEFRGEVLSLQRQIQAYQHDTTLLTTAVREELTGYFNDVADETSVDVRTDLPNPDDPNRINLTVSVIVVKDGKRYSLGKLIQTQDSITQKIFNLNNEGATA